MRKDTHTHIANMCRKCLFLQQPLLQASHQITRTAFVHLKVSFPPIALLLCCLHSFILCHYIHYLLLQHNSLWHIIQRPKINSSASRTQNRSSVHPFPWSRHTCPPEHWLPVSQPVQFKVLLLTHKALQNQAPSFLADLLQHHTPSHGLHSSNANLLSPPIGTKYWTWDFFIAAPPACNSPHTSETKPLCSHLNPK